MPASSPSEPALEFVAGPSYEDVCALTLSDAPCQVADYANLAVLTAVSALEVHSSVASNDESDPRNQEFQLLDNKLNVLIQMFAGFWRQQCELPPPVPVTVFATGLLIAARPQSLPENPQSLKLYLHDALPQPLALPVRAVELSGDEQYRVDFAPLSVDLEDALSRHIFRRHRRELAQARKAPNLHSQNE